VSGNSFGAVLRHCGAMQPVEEACGRREKRAADIYGGCWIQQDGNRAKHMENCMHAAV